MIEITKAYRRRDGTIVIFNIGHPIGYHVCPKAIDPYGRYDIDEVAAYLTEHPEALIPEPTPPAPTAEEQARVARASRNVALAEHDTLVRIALRDQRSGYTTAEARLAQLDAYAKALCDWPSAIGFPNLDTMPKLSDFIKE